MGCSISFFFFLYVCLCLCVYIYVVKDKWLQAYLFFFGSNYFSFVVSHITLVFNILLSNFFMLNVYSTVCSFPFSLHFGVSRAMAIMVTALYLSLFYGLYVNDWEYQMPMDTSSSRTTTFLVSSLCLAVYFSFSLKSGITSHFSNESDGIP